jgi:hypothetical protein
MLSSPVEHAVDAAPLIIQPHRQVSGCRRPVVVSEQLCVLRHGELRWNLDPETGEAEIAAPCQCIGQGRTNRAIQPAIRHRIPLDPEQG